MPRLRTLCVNTICAVGASVSVWLCAADIALSRHATSSTELALLLTPNRVDPYEELYVIRPGSGVALLTRAVQVDPWDARAWLLLGLSQEASGQLRSSETSLLEARRRSHNFESAWTLSNYYFRRQDRYRFWSWARQAMAIGYSDPAPLFDLCWRMSPDPSEICSQLGLHDRDSLSSFLSFLMNHREYLSASVVANRLLDRGSSADKPLLLSATSALIFHDQPESARWLWNRMISRGMIHEAPLDPQRSVSLINGGFSHFPLREGFDWRFDLIPGVEVEANGGPGALEIRFRGDQSDAGTVLYQALLLQPGLSYQLRYASQSDSTQPSGLHWRLTDFHTGAAMTGDSGELLATSAPAHQFWAFTAPSGRMPFLALVYIRPTGSTRLAGRVRLSEIHLDRIQSPTTPSQ